MNALGAAFRLQVRSAFFGSPVEPRQAWGAAPRGPGERSSPTGDRDLTPAAEGYETGPLVGVDRTRRVLNHDEEAPLGQVDNNLEDLARSLSERSPSGDRSGGDNSARSRTRREVGSRQRQPIGAADAGAEGVTNSAIATMAVTMVIHITRIPSLPTP